MENEILTKLREAIPGTQNGQRKLLTEAGIAIKELYDTVEAQAQRLAEAEDQRAFFEEMARQTPLPEAAGSVNLKAADPNGRFVAQFTFRFHSPDEAIERFPGLVQKIQALGLISEDEYIDRRRGERAAASPAPPTGNGHPPTADNGEELSFQAATLEGERKKGKDYWKVKGGKYVQHGVTIWPEVLQAAGFEVENLDTDQTYTLAGFTAYYELNPDTGNPKKVTRLVKN